MCFTSITFTISFDEAGEKCTSPHLLLFLSVVSCPSSVIAIVHLFADIRLLSCNTGNRAITSSQNIEEVFRVANKNRFRYRRQIPPGLVVVIAITELTLK